MAENPIPSPLPADLPTNWTYGQTVAPTGAEAGLATQYGYNYLMAAVNAAQAAINLIGTSFESLPELDGGKIPISQLPAGVANGVASLDQTGKVPTSQLPDMNYLPLAGGNMQGAINMGNYRITNLNTPSDNQDAATKSYVDAALTKRPIVAIGSYVGNGSTAWRSIAVGFQPDAVLLFAAGAAYTAAPTYFATAGSITMSLFEITSNGFRIKNGTYGNSPSYFMNHARMNYDYIALKFI